MLLCIPEVLTKEQVAHCRKTMDKAKWVDGRGTAGAAVGLRQAQHAAARELACGAGAGRDGAARRCPAVRCSFPPPCPSAMFPPLFNSYGVGHSSAPTWTAPIRAIPGTPIKIRTDLSVTLFLAEPEEYDGGELDGRGQVRHA